MASDTESHSLTLPPVIKEYESLIEAFTSQLHFYAKEQESLKKEFDNLIAENTRLRETIKGLLDSQLSAKGEIKAKNNEDELVDNLKSQLSLATKEKDTVVDLWQNALKNIDSLEEKLNVFEGRTHGYLSKTEVSKIKQNYEVQIKQMQAELVKCRDTLDRNLKESAESLKTKNEKLEKALSVEKDTYTLIKRLENEVKQLKGKLKEIIGMRDQLQAAIQSKDFLIEKLKVKEVGAKAKVSEAVQIVEAAFFEKDAALLRENEARGEVLKISKILTEIMDEAAEKIKIQTANIKDHYSTKLRKIQKETETMQQTLKNKDIELGKCRNECKLLEIELERIKKGNICIDESNTSKLLILEKNLESTFQKLLLSERKNLQLSAEKENIKADMEQMANCYEADVKAREIEKQVLQHELKAVRKQLKISNESLIQVAGDIQKLNTKFKLFDTEVRNKLKEKETLFEKTLRTIDNKHRSVQKGLEEQLEFYRELNKKWKTEMNEILNKVESQMRELRRVNKELHRKNKEVT